MAEYERFAIDQGSDIAIQLELVDVNGNPKNLTNFDAAAQMKRRLNANVAVPDHNVSTDPMERALEGYSGVAEVTSRVQLETLNSNCADFDIPLIDLSDKRHIPHLMPRMYITMYYLLSSR